MAVNNESFWRDLRRQLAKAEAAELAAAERVLSKIEDDAARPLPPEQIENIVEAVVAKPTPTPASKWHRYLLATTAFVLAPKFLVAATAVTAVTAVTVVTYFVQHSTQTLPYRDAVDMMMGEQLTETERRTGQRRVVGDLIESIDLLQIVANESSPIAQNAAQVLDRLRASFAGSAGTASAQFTGSLVEIRQRAIDTSNLLADRRAALEQLGDQLIYGLQGLKTVGLAPGPEALQRDNRIWQMRLETALGP